jgi:phosphohistidine phosphatase SixA
LIPLKPITYKELSGMEVAKRLAVAAKFVLFSFVFSLLVSWTTSAGNELMSNIQSQPGTKTTIVLLRHAGKSPNAEGSDPPLTVRGRKRAAALPAALGNIGVTAIYCPNLQRNIETAKPLAEHLGLKIKIISNRRLLNAEKLARELLDEFIVRHADGVVVWVGNWRNLEELYKLVDGTGDPPTKYGTICIVTIPDMAPARIKKLTYGEDVGMY